MSTRSTLALLTFAVATVVSVATSPARWQLNDEAQGEAITVDEAAPAASMHIDVDAAEIPEEAYGDLIVTLTAEDLGDDAEGDPATLDVVLVQETDAGDVELDRLEGWTFDPNAESGERFGVSAGEIDTTSATYRVDVALVDGASATFRWNAYVGFEVTGENTVPGEPSLTVTVDPAAPEGL